MKKLTGIMVVVCIAAGATAAAAQDARVRVQDRREVRVVIPDDLIAEIHRLIDTALGSQTAQTVARVARDVSRDVRAEVARHVEHARVAAGALEQNRDFKAERVDRQTRQLAIGSSGEITLKNISGHVTVKAGGGREATIEIVRTSRGRTEQDAALGLERVTAEVDVRGERASVTARYPNDNRPPYSVSIDYHVTAPAGTRVGIDTISGNVRVTGINGDLTIGGVSGSIDVSSCDRVVTVKTISGAITLTDVSSANALEVGGVSGTITLRNVKAARVSANIISGTIQAVNVQAGGASFGTTSGDIEYSGPLARSGRYEFRAHSGDVRLGVTGGFDLEARTFSGTIQTEMSLNIPPGSNRRTTLRATAGGGGAALVATTFSGNIVVGTKVR